MKRAILFTLFSCLLSMGFAQELTQTLRGKITDQTNGLPLEGINLQLVDTRYGTASNAEGNFRLDGIPIGRYIVQVTAVGFDTITIPEVLLQSGKETVLDLQMQAESSLLSEVLITGRSNPFPHDIPSVKLLTQEAVLRYPTTFYDPARLLLTYPGVVNNNDQTNGIVVRGNSPNGILWRLEGADIVNPNHTPNAGTFSDQVTQNGGGVNMLSAQLLSTSAFFNGAFPSGYGNALSGVLDMRLRPGNNQKIENTAQIGVIGIDVAMEGPFSKNSEASYVVNARYSFLGLLSAIGVDLGDEKISFADLSFNLNFPLKRGGQFTVFGVGGNSENIFEAERDSSVWEFEKDNQDITFESQTLIGGATLEIPVGQKSQWRTVVAASQLESTRKAEQLDGNFDLQPRDESINNQSKISFHSTFKHQLNASNQLKVGLSTVRQDFEMETILLQQSTARGEGGGWLFQPYVNWQTKLAGGNLVLNTGLHYTRFSFNGSDAVEPRASLSLKLKNNQQLRLAYGLHSQLQLPQLYFALTGNNENQDLDLTKSHHYVLGYERQINDKTRLTAEVYYQDLFDVPISREAGTDFSALNMLEGFVRTPLVNEGRGTNYGFELGIEKFFNGEFFYIANASIFESTYTGSDGIERATRFAGSYAVNLTGGKEWSKMKSNGKQRIWGVNLRLNSLGGFRDTPINVAASLDAGTTIYEQNQAFTLQQDAYFRTDLRVYLKKNKPGKNIFWTLDIQNLSNQENLAFSYFDTFQGQVVEKFQLGIIPILSFRMEY